jgi:hypothetical protein
VHPGEVRGERHTGERHRAGRGPQGAVVQPESASSSAARIWSTDAT